MKYVLIDGHTITTEIISGPSLLRGWPEAFDAMVYSDGLPIGEVSFPSHKYTDLLDLDNWNLWASNDVMEWILSNSGYNTNFEPWFIAQMQIDAYRQAIFDSCVCMFCETKLGENSEY